MNRYPLWKYIVVALALVVGFIYTLPNFFIGRKSDTDFPVFDFGMFSQILYSANNSSYSGFIIGAQ